MNTIFSDYMKACIERSALYNYSCHCLVKRNSFLSCYYDGKHYPLISSTEFFGRIIKTIPDYLPELCLNNLNLSLIFE